MLKADCLKIGYRAAVVAEGISFSLPDGCCALLEGPNGSGKSTLLRTLAGLQKPLDGNVVSGKVMMVPSRIPRVRGFSVREFVTTAQFGSPVSDSAVEKALREVGVESLAGKDVAEISDGEFQKACIATALAKESDVILLDEPTAFLDVDNKQAVMEMLVRVAHERGNTVLFSSHDTMIARTVVDRSLELRSGKLTETL